MYDLETIQTYWSDKALSYSAVNEDELGNIQSEVWDTLISGHLPSRSALRILDVGCGPGFFSILMARRGHQVTGVDYSDAMIERARGNIARYADTASDASSVTFRKADAQELPFADGSFDAVISRNLTWNLAFPERAYAEWLRVLAPGGVLLNFDANWHAHRFDAELAARFEADAQLLRDMGHTVEPDHADPVMDELIPILPLSRELRPRWDAACLARLGGSDITAVTDLPRGILNDYYSIRYSNSPMFLVKAVKT